MYQRYRDRYRERRRRRREYADDNRRVRLPFRTPAAQIGVLLIAAFVVYLILANAGR